MSDPTDFDFWLGEWSVSDAQGGTGRNTVRRILGGAVIEENFSFVAVDGQTLTGRSHTVLVPDRGWCQTWVDDSGSYLDFTDGSGSCGGGNDGARPAEGAQVVLVRPGQRMVFSQISRGSLQWDWQRGADADGWETVWRLDYVRD